MTKLCPLVTILLVACAAESPLDTTDSGSSSSSSGQPGTSSSSSSGGVADSSTGGGLVVLELQPVDDATADNESPDNNFGDATILEIESDDPKVQVAYLRFVVDDIEGEVVGASLRLLANEGSDYGGDVFAVDDGDPLMGMQWTEDTLTFNNAPAVRGEPIASFAAAPSASYVSFDLTGAVALGTSHSFAITTISADEIEYVSKEGAEPPLLIVTVMTP